MCHGQSALSPVFLRKKPVKRFRRKVKENREALGITPGQYLQGWRVGLAQQALRHGKPLKVVASDVGYGSEAALSRAFKAHSGLSPREWKRAHATH